MLAVTIFAATYLVLAIGRFPGFRIDRTGAAIIGASLMIGTGVLTFDEAVQAVDYSTLAGNLTILGSVANLIVVQRARPHVEISFWEYVRAGVPLTLLTLGVGAAWLQWHG